MNWRVVVYLSVVLAVCLSTTQADKEIDWWEDASLYHIYPRSFQDSNGDGVGDLNGVTTRLEYLKEIGVTAAWLSPIFESPMADNGYDISNFTKIDPIFGNLEDFDNMIAKAKQVGVKILLDFVPNHSSDECEWFQKSIRREEGFEDFYIWEDGIIDPEDSSKRLPPSNWRAIFGGSTWTWNDQRQQFYLHQFLAKQPDFNYKNPVVRQYMLEVMRYWLDRGVDGFRVDAVPYFFETQNDDGSYPDELTFDGSSPNFRMYTKDHYQNTDLLYEWRAFVDEYQKQNGGETRALLAEAYSPIEILSSFYGNGTHNGTHVAMNFDFVYLNDSYTAEDIEKTVDNWMDTIWKNNENANWVAGNHDNSRIATRVGQQKVDLVNIIIHTLPGASITYYGEEIGMSDLSTDNCIDCEFRDPVRTPMQWSPEENAGFSEGSSSWLPVVEDYETYNVETESEIPRSTLNIYKELQKLKHTSAFKNFKEEGGFSYKAVKEQVFQIIRALPGKEKYMTLVNLSNQSQYVDNLESGTFEYVVMNSYSPHSYGDKVDLCYGIYLMPYEGVVLRWLAQ